MAILIEYCGPSFDENCCSLSMLAIVIVANCLHISLRCIILNNLYIHWFRLHLLTSNCLSILSNWLCWGQGLVSRWCISFGGILDGWFRCIFIEFVLNDWLTAGTFGYICCFGLILAFNGLRNLFNLLFNFLLNLLLFLDHVHLLFGFCLIYHIFLLSLTDFIGLFFKMRLFNLYFWRGRRFIRSNNFDFDCLSCILLLFSLRHRCLLFWVVVPAIIIRITIRRWFRIFGITLLMWWFFLGNWFIHLNVFT